MKKVENTGITLIALIITIIVLLILAGVSISMVVGDNGILSQAVNATTATDIADTKEQIELALIGYYDENGEYTTDDVETAVKDVLGDDATISENNTVTTEKGNVVDISDIMASANEVIKLTAADIATMEDKTYIYGAVVNNYQVKSGATNTEGTDLQESLDDEGITWKIFYSDGTNIYLIASDYILAVDAPLSKGNHSAVYDSENYPYSIYFSNVYSDYTGSEDLVGSVTEKWNSLYLGSYSNSTNTNIRSVAYLLDTDSWSIFAGDYAKYAVGGTTIEMWCASWNEKGYTTLYNRTDSIGYYVGISSSPNSAWQNVTSSTVSNSGYDDKLYFPQQADSYDYFIASPHNISTQLYSNELVSVRENGNVIHASQGACRPMVCLSSDVVLEQISSTEYRIIEN